MIDIQKVIDLLEKKGKLSFNEIWKLLQKEFLEGFNNEFDISKLKADLLLSMSKNENLILISSNRKKEWDLKKNYTLKDIENISKKILSDELEKIEDETTSKIEE